MNPVPPLLTVALAQVRDGRLDEAAETITRAESLDLPAHLVLAARGAVEMRRHAWAAAERYFAAALVHEPEELMLHMNLGMARFELGKWEEAKEDFREALRRDHNIGSAWHKLGACYSMTQQHIEGLACLDHAVSIDPENAECHHGMSVILSHMGIEDGALHHSRRARALKENYYDAEAIEAFTLLRMGRWDEGWPKFEARWRINSPVAPWDYKGEPLYSGSLDGLRGKRVLLRSEQGFGDSIMFARFVPLVAELASHVIVETQSELERLFHVLPAEIIVHRRDEVPPFDVQTSLMSLPLLFGTTPETVPQPVRYASARRDLGVRAGVCWSGGPRPEDPPAHATDKRRSIPEAMFAPITEAVKPCVVLQRNELAALDCNDWQDTADVVGALDLVATVDTAVAHLAGSLGVRTMMLSRYDRCWRWPADGATPWYPSMMIFGQPRLGHWAPVIERVVEAVREMG
jgi:tetratricopeptide (TPR) repeat protein